MLFCNWNGSILNLDERRFLAGKGEVSDRGGGYGVVVEFGVDVTERVNKGDDDTSKARTSG